jgi:chemotaxis protein methyltransferase CheR
MIVGVNPSISITGCSILKAKSVDSEDTRRHLHDAHNRVISVAAVQRHLHASAGLGSMEMTLFDHALWGAHAFNDW